MSTLTQHANPAAASRAAFPLLAAVLTLLAPGLAPAAGLLVPAGGGLPLAIESHEVHVEILDGIAATELTQVFRNDGPEPLEAVYSFPLPPDASLAGFSLWIDGKEMPGEVLPRERARDLYEDIVRRPVAAAPDAWSRGPGGGFMGGAFKDPGLLEEVSYREFRATVFPVPARGTQQLRLTYYEHLIAADEGYRFVLPLETRAVEDSRAGSLRVQLAVHSSRPIASWWLSEQGEDGTVTELVDAHRIDLLVERASGSLDRDLVLDWRLAAAPAGLEVQPFRVAGEEGYLLLLASVPATGGESLVGPVDWTFIVDVSGSMRRQRRLDIAGEAIAGFLEGAGADDRFNVVAFNLEPTALAPRALPNDPAARGEAARFLRRFRGVGGTDLLPAIELTLAQSDPSRAQAAVVLSDGGLNDLDEDHARFLDLVEGSGLTIFALALGNDANQPLLEALAESTGGFAAGVSTREDLRRRGAHLRDRMRRVPWRDLRFEVESAGGGRSGGQVFAGSPERMPLLFPGSPLRLFARYRGQGETTFRLHATRAGEPVVLETTVNLPREAPLFPEIRRAWAESRVDDLMQGLRAGRLGEAARSEVASLGVEHSIVTPLTSFLVLETEQMYRERGIERRSHALLEEERSAREERSRVAQDLRRAPPEQREVPAAPPPRRGPPELGLGAVDPAALLLVLLLLLAPLGAARKP